MADRNSSNENAPVTEGAAGPAERLREIAAAVPDTDFGGRLGRVFEEAVRAIRALGEMELGRYEEMSETGYPDLSLWEEMAPVIRNTVIDVNRLLTAIQELFPPETRGDDPISGLIDEAIEEAGGEEALLLRRKEEASHHIRVVANALVSEISNLGERIRSPSVVSDRWNLLADVQEFRGRFRTAIGDLIYLSALPFASVSRSEVVPGYAEEVGEAIASRRAVTDLARLMSAYQARLRAATPPQVAPLLASLTRDLDAFGRSRAYATLRTQDKRRFVEFRALLHRFGQSPKASELSAAVGEFAQFAQGLSHINRRACLVEHDRQVFASCGVRLEKSDLVRRERPAESATLFAEAAALASALYGRHPSLDAWLRKAKKRDLTTLSGAELDFEVELFRGLLAASMAV